MLDYCYSLKIILDQTKEVKSGRGNAVIIRKVLKYNKDSETIERIINSCDHYKKLYDMEKKFNYRDYQINIIEKGTEIVSKNGFLYLAMQVRCGKTLTSLGIAERVHAKNILFITKKKAISSIQADYDALIPSYTITIINYESLHLVMNNKKWDLVVCDEAHSCFLGETMVDGKKIKDIDLLDSLNSFNFEKGIYEKRKVINIYKNKLTENLVKIKCNGKEIICTESHKIFTKRGWVRARDILPEDELQVL
jgi:hypothetical protein